MEKIQVQLFLSYWSLWLDANGRVVSTHKWPRAGSVAKPKWLPYRDPSNPAWTKSWNWLSNMEQMWGVEDQHNSGQYHKAAQELLVHAFIWRQHCCSDSSASGYQTRARWAGLHPGPIDKDFFGEVFRLDLAKFIHHAWVLICKLNSVPVNR